jgi:predicted nuclease of predicted toxin-antitoxin system
VKFIADVNVIKQAVMRLRSAGHEVLWVAELDRRLSDRGILRLAESEAAVVLTLDKNFRYHALQEKLPVPGVVWIRRPTRNTDLAAETERVAAVVKEYGNQLLHRFTTIYPDHVEQEPLPNSGAGNSF